ncbi:MAG: YidC/Oxa1 family insertase periplasmic-domain containing protein [Pirellulales bacterium]
MDKRFLLFLALAFAVLIGNALIMSWFFPPPPPAEQQADGPEALAPVDGDAADGDVPPEDADAADAQDETLSLEEGGEADVDADQPDEQAQAADDAQQAEAFPQRWLTLGSVDLASRYRMLITLNSGGATVERLELASRQYRDRHDRTGYLGHLEPIDVPEGGVLVRVVGQGTPAAQSGIEPGDIIERIGDETVLTVAEFEKRLADSEPGDQLSIVVARDGQELPPKTVTLTRRPLEVMRPEAENVEMRGGRIPPGYQPVPSFRMTLAQVGTDRLDPDDEELPDLDLYTANWEVVEADEDHVLFRRTLPQFNLEVLKRYALAKVPEAEADNGVAPAYHLELTVAVRNLAEDPGLVAYRLDGPTGLPIEGWWYAGKIGRQWGAVGLRDVAVQYRGASPELIPADDVAGDDVEALGQDQSLMYIGVDAQYVSAMLLPQKQQLDAVWLAESRAIEVAPELGEKEMTSLANVTCRLVSKPLELEPQGQFSHTYTVFAGPKKPELLAAYKQVGEGEVYSLNELVYYGWFGLVARGMLWLLHSFYAVVGNYGIAIVMLTVLVRGCMFPLSRKQALNMQKMQELQPEIKRIAEKYKSDVEKRTKAQQDLFKKHNYNPLGGCLLAFIQLPIFIGLYRGLMVDVELRQAPLFTEAIRWCSDLAAPDMLWNWSGIMPRFITDGVGIFGLGPYFNLLPVITVALFVVQSKMFMPPPADEQAALQQKIMQFMFIFMGILFYKVASGLCLYFIASTIWSVTERRLLPKANPNKSAEQKPAEPGKRAAISTGDGANGAGRRTKSSGNRKQKRR